MLTLALIVNSVFFALWETRNCLLAHWKDFPTPVTTEYYCSRCTVLAAYALQSIRCFFFVGCYTSGGTGCWSDLTVRMLAYQSLSKSSVMSAFSWTTGTRNAWQAWRRMDRGEGRTHIEALHCPRFWIDLSVGCKWVLVPFVPRI